MDRKYPAVGGQTDVYPQNEDASLLNTKTKKSDSSCLDTTESHIDEEDLICPICLEILQRPRILPCYHVFCVLCLQNYANSTNSNQMATQRKILCPSCRMKVQVPINGASGFLRSPTVERALEILKKGRSKPKKGLKCKSCSGLDNLGNCSHCKDWYCGKCGIQHSEKIILQLPALREKLKETQRRVHSSLEEEEEKLLRLRDNIREAIELEIVKLYKKRDELCQKVDEIKNKRKKWNKDSSAEIQDILNKSQNTSLTSLKPWEEVGKLYTSLNRLVSLNSPRYETEFTLNSATLRLNTTEEPFQTEIHKQEKWKKEDGVNAEGTKNNIEFYKHKRSYSKEKWAEKVCERPAGIAISPWTDDIYVSGSGACKIYIYNGKGKQIASFGGRGHNEGLFLCPSGIAFNEHTNELFVTDKWKHCIQVFDGNGKFLRQIGKRGKGLAEFSSPEGIAVDNSGQVYVADTCNDRVQVLDGKGMYLREIGNVTTEEIGNGHQYTRREFREPTGVFVTPNGKKIYVADSGNHKIKVFNGITGHRILSFGSQGYNKGQFESPECVAVDTEGYILVGDSGNGRVQVFKPNGHFIRYLGAKSNLHHGEHGWVSGLAVTKKKKIIVTDFKSNTIALY